MFHLGHIVSWICTHRWYGSGYYVQYKKRDFHRQIFEDGDRCWSLKYIIWWITWTFHCSEEGVWLRVGTFEPNQSSYIWPNIAIFSDISYRKTISCNIIPKPKISCNIVWMEKIILLMVFFLKMYFRFLENTVPTWRYLINVIVLKRTRLLQHRNTLWSIVNQ